MKRARKPKVDPVAKAVTESVSPVAHRYMFLTDEERATLAGDKYDAMSSDIRIYAGGSLQKSDWPKVRERIMRGVLALDQLFGFKERG